MNILFIGKRHYTNRDSLKERYGRIYQLPWHWARAGAQSQLWLIDYHGRRRVRKTDGHLAVDSTPVRGIAWLVRALATCLSRWSKHAPTHIVASGDVYIGLLGWFLARMSGARFVFDVYDRYDVFGAYRKPLGWEPFNFLLRRADACWFASRLLLQRLGNSSRGDVMIMNGIDTQRFTPMNMRAARYRMGLTTVGQMVGYFGSMEPERGVSDLIEAVSSLRSEGLPIELLVAGRKHVGTPIPELSWVHDLGDISFDDMPSAYAAVDVLCIPYRRSPFLDAASSNKIAEVLACGRPIAVTDTPNLTENFPTTAQVLRDRLAKPSNPQDLARIIRLQIEDPLVASLPEELELEKIAAFGLVALTRKSSAELPEPGLDGP